MTGHPHNYEAILQKGGQEPAPELLKRLHKGVWLNNNTMMYWTEPCANSNCFMIFPRGLDIIWGGDSRYWEWIKTISLQEDVQWEVARLLEVCWLEVNGKLEMDYLTPKTKYELSFIVMMKNPSGFQENVILKLELPNGEMSERRLCFDKLEPDEWHEVKVGEFIVGGGSQGGGEMKFGLKDITEHWKKGLMIEGVRISAIPRRPVPMNVS